MSWLLGVAERPSVSPQLSETINDHDVQVLPIVQQAHPEPRNMGSHRLENQPSDIIDYSPTRESVDTTTARQLDYITLLERDYSR